MTAQVSCSCLAGTVTGYPSAQSLTSPPFADQTLTATGTRDALLAERARHEPRWLTDILTRHDQLAIVPWQAAAPTGTNALLSLLGAAETVRA